MDALLQNLRFAFRMLWKSPGFTAIAVLTLALGIGANTAIFSMVNAVLLQPLPFHDPQQLVRIVPGIRGMELREIGLSQPEFEDLRSRAGIFDDVAVAWPVSANLTGGEHPERIELLGTSPNYFSMLGVKPQLGRVFGPQDEALGFAEAVVLSDGLWHRLFGADPNILGRKLRLDSDLYTVVGVAPPNFRHPGRTVANDVDIWASAGYRADPFPKPKRSTRLLPGVIARLKPGISIPQAQARLSAFSSELRRDFPQDYPSRQIWSIDVEPLQESIVGRVRPMLLLLMGAVVLTILIASVNIANLLLARASFRQREIGVRLALGAGRRQIVLQMLTESLLLGVLAGAVGVGTCAFSVDLLVRLAPSEIPRLHEISINGAVLSFALLLSVVTGVLFGLAPACNCRGWIFFRTSGKAGAVRAGDSKPTAFARC
jgi:putative ABC transport system permease protein